MANGPIPGEMHLNAGQEPVAVGVCAHLNPEDVVAAPRRPHHQASAKGMYPAVGAALSRKMQKTAGVGVAFVGEGAVNQDRWHEAMDLAATQKLSFGCVIEDNAWGISVPKEDSTAIANNADRAAAYGIPGVRVADNDPYEIYAAAGEAIARARAGEGPSLIEVETYRLAGHFTGYTEGYRPKVGKTHRRTVLG